MIVGKRKRPLAMLFSIRGSVLPLILPRILLVAAIAAVMVWVDLNIVTLPHADTGAFAAFGVALSLFLGFRNNAAYERWWEARKLWGQLIADSRALSREAQLFLTPEAREDTLRLTLAFVHLHRLNLRRHDPDDNAAPWIDDALIAAPHPPCAALDRIAALWSAERAAGRLDGYGARALEQRLASIALAQAGCERIQNTPLPFVYSLLVYRTAVLYCLLAPLGMMDSAGWVTPLFAGVVAYVFFGLSEVTEELENPFGETVNGLALNAMCRTIEISLMPQLGLEAPKPLSPVRHSLL
jgi:putative membrane protein